MRKNLTDEEKTKITEYGRLQCGISEVAYLLGYPTVDLLKSRTDFNEVYKKALAEGKIELRKYQFEAAASGYISLPVGGSGQKTPESGSGQTPANQECCFEVSDQAHRGSHTPSGIEIARCYIDQAPMSDRQQDGRLFEDPENHPDTPGTKL